MLRRFTFVMLLVLASLLLTACMSDDEAADTTADTTAATTASSDESGPSEDAVVRVAFFADMVTVDPDVFYDIEGDAVMLALYDGLLRYAHGSTELEGALAERWEESDDGLTYTFHLRPDAKFSDGTPVTSDAVQKSFERRTAVDQGPAYMLADVARYETPDEQTLVIVLKQKVAGFLDLMASLWGPKVINPKVLDEHAKDQAQEFLKTNAAGTGPFTLESFKQGTGYTLARNPNYWGEPPYFAKAEVSVQPDVSAQLLKLQRGDLDAIMHGFPLANLDSVESDDKLAVESFESLGTTTLFLNHNKPALADVAVRRALIQALDVETLIEEVYGDTATVPEGAYPSPLLPDAAPVDYTADADGANQALEDGLTLEVVYTPDSSGVQRRLADLMRQRLALVDVTANVRQVELGTVFGYRDDVKNAADIYVSTPTPDGAHPDAWGRIVWYTKGGLNFFNYSNAKVDAALDAGLRAGGTSEEDYGEAGRLATADWAVVPIAQVKDLVVTRADLDGVEHVPAYPWTIDLAKVFRSS